MTANPIVVHQPECKDATSGILAGLYFSWYRVTDLCTLVLSSEQPPSVGSNCGRGLKRVYVWETLPRVPMLYYVTTPVCAQVVAGRNCWVQALPDPAAILWKPQQALRSPTLAPMSPGITQYAHVGCGVYWLIVGPLILWQQSYLTKNICWEVVNIILFYQFLGWNKVLVNLRSWKSYIIQVAMFCETYHIYNYMYTRRNKFTTQVNDILELHPLIMLRVLWFMLCEKYRGIQYWY